MDNFSRRIGLVPIVPVQIDSINDALRNGAWTIIYELLSKNIQPSLTGYEASEWRQKSADIIRKIWIDFFKLASDSISWDPERDIKYLKNRFYKFSWNEFYDFIEFFTLLEDSYNRPALIDSLYSFS